MKRTHWSSWRYCKQFISFHWLHTENGHIENGKRYRASLSGGTKFKIPSRIFQKAIILVAVCSVANAFPGYADGNTLDGSKVHTTHSVNTKPIPVPVYERIPVDIPSPVPVPKPTYVNVPMWVRVSVCFRTRTDLKRAFLQFPLRRPHPYPVHVPVDHPIEGENAAADKY